MPNAHVAAAATGLPALDINQITTAASNLAHLLDTVVNELCGVTRDRENCPEDAGALDRAEALAVIGRDFAERLGDRVDANYAALSRAAT